MLIHGDLYYEVSYLSFLTQLSLSTFALVDVINWWSGIDSTQSFIDYYGYIFHAGSEKVIRYLLLVWYFSWKWH